LPAPRKPDSTVTGNGCFIAGFMMICTNGKDEKAAAAPCRGAIGPHAGETAAPARIVHQTRAAGPASTGDAAPNH